MTEPDEPDVPGFPLALHLAEAAKWDDLQLDLNIAALHAHEQVYRRRGLVVKALMASDYWMGLADIRRDRQKLAEAVDDALLPTRQEEL